MSMLLKSDITKYKSLYKQRFGVVLTDKVAEDQLTRLVRQVEVIYQPITRAQARKYENEDVDNEPRRPEATQRVRR